MNKSNLKNKKGFTLVELLAVIVVLAIIILIAMPSVMSAMDKARRNALITEANEITKIATTAYADDSMGTGITKVCYNLKYLSDNGYLDKNLSDYTGQVGVEVDANGKVTTKVWLSNGIYKIVTEKADGASPTGLSVKENIASGNVTENDCSSYCGDNDGCKKVKFPEQSGQKK